MGSSIYPKAVLTTEADILSAATIDTFTTMDDFIVAATQYIESLWPEGDNRYYTVFGACSERLNATILIDEDYRHTWVKETLNWREMVARFVHEQTGLPHEHVHHFLETDDQKKLKKTVKHLAEKEAKEKNYQTAADLMNSVERLGRCAIPGFEVGCFDDGDEDGIGLDMVWTKGPGTHVIIEFGIIRD